MPDSKQDLHQEIELKYRFHDETTFEQVKKIAMALSKENHFPLLNQINYFFDTVDLDLRKNSLALRLRYENQHFILCIKGNDPRASKNQKGMSIKLEYENSISKEAAQRLLENQCSPLDYLTTKTSTKEPKKTRTRDFLYHQIKDLILQKPLKMIGSFSNQRTCIPIMIAEKQFLLEMDKTTFKQEITHYEIELEIPAAFYHEDAENFLQTLFQKANASFFASNGKAERFYQFLTS